HFREAMRLVLEAGGSRHSLVAALWVDLAGVEVARGKPRAATPLYERAADLYRSALGEDHPDHAAARRVLGLHLQTQGEHGRAGPRRSWPATWRSAAAASAPNTRWWYWPTRPWRSCAASAGTCPGRRPSTGRPSACCAAPRFPTTPSTRACCTGSRWSCGSR